ncbi:hypothetical protein TCAL_00846 [Tigriopus californicus]|uniref:N-acetylglucosamine-6-phosphate deacetylase n=2 Tax=Tigriopus californicus TaxID=6832 RepID=A0A553NFV8_TIGCA|nr:hypothetical protein TCAL_00846 [Tigriopus californicus]|eukprot:TCALIF_00846-PA protein Name:"Similar to CG17065 Putative N-acetylglucosamine-6-phosphate deacetylase (Drosophila melanogaster)" AED:0.03 eAED:0.03 QI:200/1/1/1/1/1/2/164/411
MTGRRPQATSTSVTVFRNCMLLRNHEIRREDLWVRDGIIIDPEPLFFDEQVGWNQEIDCGGVLIAPGLIDLQINGGFGVDFSYAINDQASAQESLVKVAKGILAHGVTSFCPTIVTSSQDKYHAILPWITPTPGSAETGAEILGAHVEGPFIAVAKKGAHTEEYIRDLSGGSEAVEAMYGSLNNVRIITLAPEHDPTGQVVRELCAKGISVSMGHSSANLTHGETAALNGATLITHLFNAMSAFHHRDPGLLGLLTSKMLHDKSVYYGIIADGIHTHPAALRMAYRTNFPAMCLVTDAICAMGLEDGTYHLGPQSITVEGQRAVITGTDTLCGAIATLFRAVQKLIKGARCSIVEALEAASLHPAEALGIQRKKGSLDFGCDADFIMINVDEMDLLSTWIGGKRVYKKPEG